MSESKPLTKEQEGFANSFLDGMRFVMETKSADKLTKKVISMIDAKYEQGKADGAKEMWEKMNHTCANSHCSFYMENMCQTNKIENCPIAKGEK